LPQRGESLLAESSGRALRVDGIRSSESSPRGLSIAEPQEGLRDDRAGNASFFRRDDERLAANPEKGAQNEPATEEDERRQHKQDEGKGGHGSSVRRLQPWGDVRGSAPGFGLAILALPGIGGNFYNCARKNRGYHRRSGSGRVTWKGGRVKNAVN
jgi:hypothetical protein